MATGRWRSLASIALRAALGVSFLLIGMKNAFFVLAASLALMAVSPWLLGSRQSRAFVRFAGLLIAVLLIAETGFRLLQFGPQGLSVARYSPVAFLYRATQEDLDPGTVTGLRAGSRFTIKGAEVSINEEGFRDRLRPRAKPRGTYRIALIGASMAVGTGVAERDRFSSVLERELNEPAALARLDRKTAEVINLGQPGAQYAHLLDNLKTVGLAYQPDLILLELNEQILDGLGLAGVGSLRDRLLKRLPERISLLRRLEMEVDGAFFVVQAFAAARDQAWQRLWDAWRGEEPRRLSDRELAAIGTVFAKTREIAGALPVIVYVFMEHLRLFPTADGAGPEFVEALRAAARPYGIQVAAFEIGARAAGHGLFIYPGDYHPSPFAHATYAGLLRDAILETRPGDGRQ